MAIHNITSIFSMPDLSVIEGFRKAVPYYNDVRIPNQGGENVFKLKLY